jgi:hypothetical protein
MPRRKTERKPRVGIFYLLGKRLLVDSSALDEAEPHGEFRIHSRSHEEYWAELCSSGTVPDTEYEHFPRGRVAFNQRNGEFLLLADCCILRQRTSLRRVYSLLNIPRTRTDIRSDDHYRCAACLS